MKIRHAFECTEPEGTDSSKVRTSNWNEDHVSDAAEGSIFYVGTGGAIEALAPDVDGRVLGLSGGVPQWITYSGGGGESLIVHPAEPTALAGQTVSVIDDLKSGLDSSWTVVAADSAHETYTATSDGILLQLNTPASYYRLAVLRDLPAMNIGDAYAIRARYVSWNYVNYPTVAVVFSTGVTVSAGTQFYAADVPLHGGNVRHCFGLETGTGFNSRSNWYGDNYRNWNPDIWIRMVKTGSITYRIDYSEDGRIWLPVTSVDNGTAFTKVGFGANIAESSAGVFNVLVSDFVKMTGVS